MRCILIRERWLAFGWLWLWALAVPTATAEDVLPRWKTTVIPSQFVQGQGEMVTSPIAGQAEREARFVRQFRDPPPGARILKIIHGWPDDPAAQDGLIRALVGQGFGGVVCNVSFSQYLESEEKWLAFKRAVIEARKAGFALWLYDEKGYPSGTAGGIVLRDHPEWEARGLLIADAESEGGPITLPLPPGKPFLMAAAPVLEGHLRLNQLVDLSARVRDGNLVWEAPPGRWRVLAICESRLYEGTHASLSLADHIPYPNLLQPEPIARFLAVTHQRYAEHLGKDLGQWFVSTFTDEPSLMSLFLKPMPYRVLPWSPNLPVEFKRRHGYALEPLLPGLVANAGTTSQKARHDYWQTVGELVAESFFGQIQHWCQRHHLLSGGHLLMEENLVAHVPLYGDFFRCLQRLDAPSIDCLTSIPDQVPWFIARLAGSAADLGGKTTTMCETSDHSQRYRPPADKRPVRTVTEAEIRGTCNRLIVAGINTITSYYSFATLSQEQLRRLNQWVGRCCAALRGGHQVADLAVLYPIESVWPRFTPARHYANDSAGAAQIEARYHDVSESLFAAGRDFTYVDGPALANATVQAGTLAHGQLRWRVIILPGADTLPLPAWENLARFVRGGGVCVAVGARPTNSETEFPCSRVQALAKELFGPASDETRVIANRAGGAGIFLSTGAAGLLPAIIQGILEPDVAAVERPFPLRVTHRRITGHEVYFVINDRNEPWTGQISLAATGPGEQCDPATGEISPLAGGSQLPLSLTAYGGMLFRFPTARSSHRFKISSGILPQIHLQNLPTAQPLVARGEFVREELAADQAERPGGQPAWRVTGQLTKGRVDTYLFLRLPYPQPLDLSGAECLVVDTWVPAGQQTTARFLAILHLQNGADYLAETGRLLGAPGYNQLFIPFSRFQLAGWSNDPKGRLDLSTITEIRLGWGGYYGKEGERIQFTVAPLQIATVTPSP